MDTLENAGRLPAWDYTASILYTMLSPCALCSGAILLYGTPKVVIAENLNFMGEEKLLKSRGVELEILNDEHCIHMMKTFIKNHTDLWLEDIGT